MSPEPTKQPSINEPAETPSHTRRTPAFTLLFFLLTGFLIAIQPTFIIIVTPALADGNFRIWMGVKLCLSIWVPLFVFGSVAEAFMYARWWLRTRCLRRDGAGGISKERYRHSMTQIYYSVAFFVPLKLAEFGDTHYQMLRESKGGVDFDGLSS
ncbi:hypothetical protein F5Y04DRAFT_285720 [Hypomontagnella monticulosa]|nr:hypothetical protein F5Y04DRAFT_285720 [Hypomontagnella monticulosa]